jgi:hypothetical protein
LPGSIIDKEIQGLVQTFTDSQVRKGAPAKYFKGHIDEISESLFRAAEIRASAGIVLDKITNKAIEAMIIQDVTMKKINADQYMPNLKNERDRLVDLRTRAAREGIRLSY